jgi:hypothetical protein
VTGFIKMGGDILSHTNAVPSARTGLTSLFGMGRGGPRRYSHLKILNTLGSVYKERIDKHERKYTDYIEEIADVNRKYTGN